jgi:neutral trehalase
MFEEMYYWDSCFMGLGLIGTEHEDLIFDLVENLAFLFRRFGIIPNGNRYYFLSRSQPPFFTQLIPHYSLAGFYPLWAGLATPDQAERIVQSALPRFEFPGGLVTTTQEQVGRQWAFPNGWAPLQWIVVAGLERYGYTADARRIMEKWCVNCASIFAATGAMWEKYNVVQTGDGAEVGLYGSLAGFGWTNGVFVDFARRLEVTT